MIAKVKRAEFLEILSEPVDGISSDDRDEMAFPSYLHSNPLIRWLMWRRYEVIARIADAGPDTSVLEFGCGSGVFLPELCARGATVYAIDLLPVYAQRLVESRKLAVNFVQDLSNLADGSVDIIVAADVLEHITDLQPYLEQFVTKLAANGRLIVSGPTESWLYRLGRIAAGFAGKGDYHHTNIDHLILAIKNHGFQVESIRQLPFPLLPPLFKVIEFRRPQS